MAHSATLRFLFTATAITTVLSQLTTTDKPLVSNQCPQNYQWEPQLAKCLPECTQDAQLKEILEKVCVPKHTHSTNLTTAESVKAELNDTRPIPSLPECFNVTMSAGSISTLTYDKRKEFSGAYNESPNGQLSTCDQKFANDRAKHFNNSFNKDFYEPLITTCYPIADTLKQCKQRLVLEPTDFVHFPDNGTLTASPNQRTYTLGEFFLVQASDANQYLTEEEREQVHEPADNYAIVCNDTQKRPKRYCNYIEVPTHKYREIALHNGLCLPWRHETLWFAEYEIMNDTGLLKLCYPLTNSFRACDKWVLEKDEFTRLDGYRLYSQPHKIEYDIGEYFYVASGGAAVCVIRSTGPPPYDYYRVHAVLYSISAACLLLAFVIHLIVPSINYHAKPLLCHIFSLMAMYVGLTARKFTPTLTTSTCYILFVMMHYFSLAAFFWLNVLAFDLWRIFADLKSRIGRVSCITCNVMACNNTRFYAYCAYAWGIPMVITATAILLDQVPDLQDVLSMPIKIRNMCWLQNFTTSLVLFYGPMAVILVENTIFFMLTVWNLRQVSRGTEFVNKKLNKQLFFVCVKLFVVMGLCWLIEVVSWATGSDRNTWYIPDLINAMQGIVIFIIYICKPTTFKLLRNRFIRSPGGKWTVDINGSKTHDNRTSSTNISVDNMHVIGDKIAKEHGTVTTSFSNRNAKKQ